MKKVTTAIVGLGYWGPNLLRNFAAQEFCTMRWGCDFSDKNLAKMRAHYPALHYTKEYQEVLNDAEVELVLIATPTSSHFPLAKQALEAGKHVFIEKPMTGTSKEAEQLLAIAKRKKRMIFVDHTFVFTSAVEKIAELTRKRKLGKLLYYDSVRINLGIIQKDSNVLADLAVHDLAILSAITDLKKIQTVTAFGAKHFGKQEEVAHLHLEYSDGFHAHISVSWLSPVKIRQTIVAGTKSMVTFHDTEPSEKLRMYDRGVERDDTKPDPFFPKYRSGDIVIPALPLTEALGVEALHVLRCIRGKERARASGEHGLQIVHILERATQSMRKGKTLRL